MDAPISAIPPDGGAQRNLPQPISSQPAAAYQPTTSQAPPAVRPQAQFTARQPSGQAPFHRPSGPGGLASQPPALLLRGPAAPGAIPLQWTPTASGGTFLNPSTAVGSFTGQYRVPANATQSYAPGQLPSYIPPAGLRGCPPGVSGSSQPPLASGGPQPPGSAPLQSLAGSIVFAASRPPAAGRPPGPAAQYRMPTASTVGPPRGPVPQISSQAYIKQASAQLQGFPGYPYSYLQTQGAFPLGRGLPMGPPMRPVGQSLRPASSLYYTGPMPPSSMALPPQATASVLGGYPRPVPIQVQGRAVPISGPTASIPHIKRPGAPKVEWLGPTSTQNIPGVFTVSDRKVRVTPGEEETTPMYVLLRRWVQNEPSLRTPARSVHVFTRPVPVPPAPPEPPGLQMPIMDAASSSSSSFATEDLLKVHKRHWMKVRRYHMIKRNIRLDHFCQHLATLIPDPSLRSRSPMEVDHPPQLKQLDGPPKAHSLKETAAISQLQPVGKLSSLPAAAAASEPLSSPPDAAVVPLPKEVQVPAVPQ